MTEPDSDRPAHAPRSLLFPPQTARRSRRQLLLQYGFAIAAPLLAAAATKLLSNHLSEKEFIVFLLAVVASALFGGAGPGLLATAVSLAGALVDFGPPLDDTAAERLGLLAAAGTLVSVLNQMFLNARWQAASRQRALGQSEERYSQLVESIRDYGIFTLDPRGRILSWNIGAQRATGYSHEEAVGQHFSFIYREEDVAAGQPEHELRAALEKGRYEGEGWRVRKDGSLFWEREVLTPVYDNGDLVGFAKVAQDRTEQKRMEETVRSKEEQLRQAQKMESVGRLAGGIAHDFNNLLTVIRGNTQLLLMDAPEADPAREGLVEIDEAAERAAGLTGQLLAFSRRQVIQPRVLELNALVENAGKMLRRLLREDVEFVTRLDPQLGRVKVDPGQMEQVLMNLAVNAGDAMPRGGKLILETRNVELDEEYAHGRVQVEPGSYVLLAVSDTGEGMSKEVQEKALEPFFTTKPQGKGTGLGLSTVYGIVKQNGGYLWIYSEVGVGTTFKIYLPRAEEALSAEALPPSAPEQTREAATILVVEDDAAVRSVVVRTLERAGHNVLTAEGGEAALRACREHAGAIQMMITDVVMPGMSGKELATRAKRFCPAVRVLYMSGYTDEAISHHGVLDPGIEFINKPFGPEVLRQKVREILDGGPGAASPPAVESR